MSGRLWRTLPYKQEVGGSSPSPPTTQTLLIQRFNRELHFLPYPQNPKTYQNRIGRLPSAPGRPVRESRLVPARATYGVLIAGVSGTLQPEFEPQLTSVRLSKSSPL